MPLKTDRDDRDDRDRDDRDGVVLQFRPRLTLVRGDADPGAA